MPLPVALAQSETTVALEETTSWSFATEESLGLQQGKHRAGRGEREQEREAVPEGTDLCVYFDPATIFICFSHILFTAPLS